MVQYILVIRHIIKEKGLYREEISIQEELTTAMAKTLGWICIYLVPADKSENS